MTILQKRDTACMEKVNQGIRLLIALFVFLLIIESLTAVTYAKEEDEVNVHINTTQSEFQKLYEWFLKDKYDVSVDGELNVRASLKDQAPQVPVDSTKDNRGQDMVLAADNIINFFSKYWPYIAGGLGLILAIIFIRTWRKSRWSEEDYYDFYYDPPVRYRQRDEEVSFNTISLHQRLGVMQSMQQPNMYYHTTSDNDGPYIIPKRDYSRYNENNQFNIIKQKVMYYK